MQNARITRPSTPITDQAFVYRRSECTNVAETFARARQQQAAEAPAASAAAAPKRSTRRATAASRTTHALLPLQLPIL